MIEMPHEARLDQVEETKHGTSVDRRQLPLDNRKGIAIRIAGDPGPNLYPAFAEKLVDPTRVAPEYRDAAEKRRAEQLKQLECSHKADAAKVIPRERTAFLLQCLEADAVK